MASVSKDKGGYRIQWVGANSVRHTLRLGAWGIDKAGAHSIKARIESLQANLITGDAPKPDLAAWLRDLPDDFHEAIASRGLTASRATTRKHTLGDLLKAYFGNLTVKPGTVLAYKQARRSLEGHFGEARTLASIKVLDADEWVKALRGSGLASATQAKRIKIAKAIFARGVRWGMLAESPLADVKAGSQRNADRAAFVSRTDIAKVLEVCDPEWRAIIALSRFGGLRCPTEVQALRWGDVDWDAGRMRVRSTKTEHHEGGEARYCPIFPELLPHLREAFEHAEERAVFVVSRYRGDNANLRTQFIRLLESAGVKRWPRIFHNMRASRQTELAAEFPLVDVCSWLGNSPTVAAGHYLQATDENFKQATQRTTGVRSTSQAKDLRVENGGANCDARGVQNATPRASAAKCEDAKKSSQVLANCSVTHKEENPCTCVQGSQVGAEGFEPP